MPSAKELMRAGELFPGDDPALDEERQRCQARLAMLNAMPPGEDAARRAAFEQLLAAVGEGTQIRTPFYCDYGDGIRIGADCFLNFNCVLLDGAAIELGEKCLLGPAVQLVTATHPLEPARRRTAIEQALPIRLGDGVWLGAGVIVCPGVSIGENTVVGAGSVVVRDLPAGVLAVGNPARVVRELPAG